MRRSRCPNNDKYKSNISCSGFLSVFLAIFLQRKQFRYFALVLDAEKRDSNYTQLSTVQFKLKHIIERPEMTTGHHALNRTFSEMDFTTLQRANIGGGIF